MTKILIIGAGRSATSLIDYMLKSSIEFDWKITVADADKKLAEQKIHEHENATAISFNITEEE
ncbi:MAG: saccharopine dehydrogenase, partial [Bacteroidia bacterium]